MSDDRLCSSSSVITEKKQMLGLYFFLSMTKTLLGFSFITVWKVDLRVCHPLQHKAKQEVCNIPD